MGKLERLFTLVVKIVMNLKGSVKYKRQNKKHKKKWLKFKSEIRNGGVDHRQNKPFIYLLLFCFSRINVS